MAILKYAGRVSFWRRPIYYLMVLCGSLTAVNAQESSVTGDVLHEEFSVPKAQSARTSRRLLEGTPVLGPSPSARQNPTAIASQDKLLAAPDQTSTVRSGEPVLGRGGFGAERQSSATLDYFTGADNTLHYVEVFNPSIVPFKRMSALDSIDENFVLYSSSKTRFDLPVGGEPEDDQDLFWGAVAVELQTGVDVPIPSVSPDMRILSYESTPAIDLVFSRDASHNYFVRTEETGSNETYRVVFLAESVSSYFVPTIPPKLRISAIPDEYLQPMPSAVRSVAERAHRKLKVHSNMFVKTALDTLIRYFRSFDAKSPPPKSGNIYWDLFNNKAGVCRHRSFAFMITANALGIPTRYVTNEAHAWVEVWLPGTSWMRIDLGGAASTLEVSNASDKSMYRPRGEDPFPQPKNYSENYTRLAGDVRGLRDDQIADRQRPYSGTNGESEGNGEFFGMDEGNGALERPTRNRNLAERPPLTGPGKGLPNVPESELQDKIPTISTIESASSDGYRGETIHVRGSVMDIDGNGLAGLRVHIFLAPANNDGDDALLVGQSLTKEGGVVDTEAEIPRDLPVRDYEVFISTAGDESYQPSVSE